MEIYSDACELSRPQEHLFAPRTSILKSIREGGGGGRGCWRWSPIKNAKTYENLGLWKPFKRIFTPKGRTIRKVMGGGGLGKIQKKNSCKPKCPKKRFLQAETEEKKILAEGD